MDAPHTDAMGTNASCRSSSEFVQKHVQLHKGCPLQVTVDAVRLMSGGSERHTPAKGCSLVFSFVLCVCEVALPF